MTTPLSPLCMYCKFFHNDDLENDTCSAYPNGIPDEILDNEWDHRQPQKGDKGILFNPEKQPPKYLLEALDALNK